MKKLYKAKQKNIRLFSNSFLEAITTTHHYVPFIIFIPVIIVFITLTGYFIYEGKIEALFPVPLLSVAAFLLWTIIEYIGHRFVFHYKTENKTIKQLLYLIHWAHHDYPDDTKRLVVPPIVTIPAGFILYFLSYLLFGLYYAAPFFAVLVSSYLLFDWFHFASHHYNFKNIYFQKLKKHHLLHHYKDPDNGFGFVTTLWDRILNTMYKA